MVAGASVQPQRAHLKTTQPAGPHCDSGGNGHAAAALATPPAAILDAATRQFYLWALDTLDEAGVRYVVAGAYALAYHAGIFRHTKDLDLFVRRQDVPVALAALESAGGCRGEWTHPHWLAKAYARDADAFLDFIFRSANGMCPVDDAWLDNACPGDVLGRPTPLCPAEEMIWSKSWVQARERFDGADIAHLIQARGHKMDWRRLIDRFAGGKNDGERVLLAHLITFGFIYPAEKDKVPQWVIDELMTLIRREPLANGKVCRGTMLSWDQYLPDVTERGYADARVQPYGALTQDEVDRWTAAPK
jgi:hypothetical protein